MSYIEDLNELCFDNWVFDQIEDRFTQLKAEDLARFYSGQASFLPISLYEDYILERCGFVFNEELERYYRTNPDTEFIKFYLEDNGQQFDFIRQYGDFDSLEGNDRICEVSFVHELQNLWYLLTKEELIFKPHDEPTDNTNP